MDALVYLTSTLEFVVKNMTCTIETIQVSPERKLTSYCVSAYKPNGNYQSSLGCIGWEYVYSDGGFTKAMIKKTLITLAIALAFAGCSISHYNRSNTNTGEEVSISNYSAGMDRDEVDIDVEGDEKKKSAKVKIGRSNSSDGIQKAIDALENLR